MGRHGPSSTASRKQGVCWPLGPPPPQVRCQCPPSLLTAESASTLLPPSPETVQVCWFLDHYKPNRELLHASLPLRLSSQPVLHYFPLHCRLLPSSPLPPLSPRSLLILRSLLFLFQRRLRVPPPLFSLCLLPHPSWGRCPLAVRLQSSLLAQMLSDLLFLLTPSQVPSP